ncbi:MAG: PaaI family thioesterase [Hyphomonadaceae bacterium]
MTNPADAMPFAKLMGVIITEATQDRVVGDLEVRADLCTAGGILHGGAIMAFADTLGATGAFLALPSGAVGTTTIESKTNFLGAAKTGVTVRGETTPVHRGSRTSVWQTRISTLEGKPVALVTQTQMVLYPPGGGA